MFFAAGHRLGPYEILAPVGAGGMGEVYKARDTRLHRTVAIKVLPHDKLAHADRKRRFLQEARTASALMHPNIVVLHDISSDNDVDFLVMEFVPGRTLKECIKAGPLPPADVVRYGAQIASALAAAHSAGVVHRDIKPANVMVTPESQIKVLDFGLAKLSEPLGMATEEDTRTIAAETEPGVVMGTVAYMSPEQTRGEPLDGQSDIFSLGCVLYETATGRLPFPGPSTLAVMHEIATANPVPPSAINKALPQGFDHVIEKALAKNKDQRFATASEVLQELQALEPRPAASPARKRLPKWLLAVAASIIVVAAGTAAYMRWWPPKHVPDPQARELYLQGRRDIQEFTEYGFKKSIDDFNNAIARDPDYAAAYAGLADAYSYQAGFELERPKDVMPLAESNAARAIEKDPQTAEAYTSLGIVALTYYWEFPLAEQRFQRAIKLNQNDAFTQHFLGHYYELAGKWPEALAQMQRAHNMDRLSPMFGEDLALDLIANRRFDDAIPQLRETVALARQDPLARVTLAVALEKSNEREALESALQALNLPGHFTVAGTLAGVFSRLHHPEQAQQILQELESAEKAGNYVAPVEIAMVEFALGNRTKGMERMRQALADRSFNLGFSVSDPVYDPLREDPEFAALMNEIHLPRAAWHDIPRYRK